jgi:flagellar basal body L-ring protein FlgH
MSGPGGRLASVALAAALLAGPPSGARAQQPVAVDSTAPSRPAASAGIPDSGAASAVPQRAGRAGWLSDRLVLRPGDILTVVVDDQTAARERVSRIAVGNRGQRAGINAGIPADPRLGPEKSFATRLDSDSRDVGEANRFGDLTAVLSARVTSIEPGGVVRIRGSKRVTVDGRLQEITVEGAVRSQDVRWDNTVLSGAIADAVITYNGKKIGPRTGILGKILGIVWP